MMQDSKNGVNTQLPLTSYCDGNSDVIILSFTLGFSNGNLPTLNLAGTCDSPNFPGTNLLSCPDVGAGEEKASFFLPPLTHQSLNTQFLRYKGLSK